MAAKPKKASTEAWKLEEFKVLTSGAMESFRLLVLWFIFFCTFELTALAFLLKEHSLISNINKICIVFTFMVFHIIGILATYAVRRHFMRIEERIKNRFSAIQGADPFFYRTYGHFCYLMILGLLMSFVLWSAQLFMGAPPPEPKPQSLSLNESVMWVG